MDGWGDLNVIKITHEKNRPSIIIRSMRDFNSFMNQNDFCNSPLMNAKLHGRMEGNHPYYHV